MCCRYMPTFPIHLVIQEGAPVGRDTILRLIEVRYLVQLMKCFARHQYFIILLWYQILELHARL